MERVSLFDIETVGPIEDISRCRIIAAAFTTKDGKIENKMSKHEDPEEEILDWIFERVGSASSLAGYNIAGFDLPMIYGCSLKLGIRAATFDGDVVDPYPWIYYRHDIVNTDQLLERLHLPPPLLSNKQIEEAWNRHDYQSIAEHNIRDVENERKALKSDLVKSWDRSKAGCLNDDREFCVFYRPVSADTNKQTPFCALSSNILGEATRLEHYSYEMLADKHRTPLYEYCLWFPVDPCKVARLASSSPSQILSMEAFRDLTFCPGKFATQSRRHLIELQSSPLDQKLLRLNEVKTPTRVRSNRYGLEGTVDEVYQIEGGHEIKKRYSNKELKNRNTPYFENLLELAGLAMIIEELSGSSVGLVTSVYDDKAVSLSPTLNQRKDVLRMTAYAKALISNVVAPPEFKHKQFKCDKCTTHELCSA